MPRLAEECGASDWPGPPMVARPAWQLLQRTVSVVENFQRL